MCGLLAMPHAFMASIALGHAVLAFTRVDFELRPLYFLAAPLEGARALAEHALVS
jgi:hypothetical protein